jgi:4-hydroxyproline epimerase
MQRIQVIDSHTGGEPTRVVISGGPDLGKGSLAERVERFRNEFDHVRRGVVCEPRGSEVIVGALLCPPADPTCAAGVIFFNNVGYLGMCGHGTIGLAVTLGHLGRIGAGQHVFETPVGKVAVEYDGKNHVSLDNVPSYRFAANVAVQVEGIGEVVGDVAWGGNWFFLAKLKDYSFARSNIRLLTDAALRIRNALRKQGITGADGAEIDHIELFGRQIQGYFPLAEGRGRQIGDVNFVLCPGGAYDRSPCGTGTSAKVACLAADGKLEPGVPMLQHSITGSYFGASYRLDAEGRVIPRISGSAYITAEANLIVENDDPMAWGIPD